MSIITNDYSLDLDRNVLSIEWGILGCGEHKISTYGPQGALGEPGHCGPFNQTVDVYLNDTSNMIFSYNPNKLPIDPTLGPASIRELNSFRTDHGLHPSASAIDSYTFHASMFAIDPTTNLSVQISHFAVANFLDGFTISSRGAKVMKEFTCLVAAKPTIIEIESQVFAVELERSEFAQAFGVCVFGTNWILTIASTYATATAVKNGRVGLPAALLHASVALAIPILRTLYIGPPPPHASRGVDGFCSQIAIMALSSMVLLYHVLTQWRSGKMSSQSIEKA